MKTFKVVNDDLVFDDTNNLVLISGNKEIRQSVERIVTTNIREWFLNIDFGLDYDSIRGKRKTKEDIKLALREAIYQDNRIKDVVFKDLDLNRETRHLKVNIDASVNNELIEGIEVNIID